MDLHLLDDVGKERGRLAFADVDAAEDDQRSGCFFCSSIQPGRLRSDQPPSIRRLTMEAKPTRCITLEFSLERVLAGIVAMTMDIDNAVFGFVEGRSSSWAATVCKWHDMITRKQPPQRIVRMHCVIVHPQFGRGDLHRNSSTAATCPNLQRPFRVSLACRVTADFPAIRTSRSRTVLVASSSRMPAISTRPRLGSSRRSTSRSRACGNSVAKSFVSVAACSPAVRRSARQTSHSGTDPFAGSPARVHRHSS